MSVFYVTRGKQRWLANRKLVYICAFVIYSYRKCNVLQSTIFLRGIGLLWMMNHPSNGYRQVALESRRYPYLRLTERGGDSSSFGVSSNRPAERAGCSPVARVLITICYPVKIRTSLERDIVAAYRQIGLNFFSFLGANYSQPQSERCKSDLERFDGGFYLCR